MTKKVLLLNYALYWDEIVLSCRVSLDIKYHNSSSRNQIETNDFISPYLD